MSEEISRRDFFGKIFNEILPTLTFIGLTLKCSSEGIPIPYKKNIALLGMNFQKEFFSKECLDRFNAQQEVINYLFDRGDLSIYFARDFSSREPSIENSLIERYLLDKSRVEGKPVNYFDLGNNNMVDSAIREIKKNRIESIVLMGKNLKNERNPFENFKNNLNREGIFFYSSTDIGGKGLSKDVNYLSNNYSEMLKKIFN